MDGYANVHAASTEPQEITLEVQSEMQPQNVIPNVINPLFQTASSYDFTSDDSYQRYLSNETPFNDLDYVPVDLAPINSNFTANNAKKFQLRQVAGDAFADMAWHFRNEFKGDRLSVFSAYRSKSYQDELIKK